jgi:hypothetical protein
MANELHAECLTGLTIYAVLLNSTGQVWNGAAWETINGANWATYDIAMTEAAAGIYLATMPAVVAGAYSYVAYSQAGVNPATTDRIRGTGYLQWDGVAELPLAVIEAQTDDIGIAGAGLTAIPGVVTVTGNVNGNVGGNVVGSVGSVVGLTNDTITDTVWAEVLPGVYVAGTAGNILGNIIATISAAIFAHVTDGYTYGQITALVAAAILGKTSGWAAAAPVYRSIDDSANRVSGVVDGNGNRTTVVLTP